MELKLSDEQRLLQDTVRRLCERKFGLEVLREHEGKTPGFSDSMWQSLIELGFAGAAIPAEFGGSELSALDIALVYEEFGRALVPSPHFVSSILAAQLLTAESDSAFTGLLGAIADGTTIVTVACAEPGRDLTRDGVAFAARRDGEHWLLDGRKHFVAHADVAQHVILLARADDGRVLGFLVGLPDDCIAVRYQPTLSGEPCFELRLENVRVPAAAVLGGGADYWGRWSGVMSAASIPLAAQAVGAAERILEIAVAYSRERHAFGRAIGGFQAIAHMLSANLVQVKGCSTLTRYAAWCQDQDKPYAALAAMAKLKACEAFRMTCNTAIQVHGGLGYTLEASPQLFFRRAKQWQLLYTDEPLLEETIAGHVLDADGGRDD